MNPNPLWESELCDERLCKLSTMRLAASAKLLGSLFDITPMWESRPAGAAVSRETRSGIASSANATVRFLAHVNSGEQPFSGTLLGIAV